MNSYEDAEDYLHSHDNACTVGELKKLLNEFDDDVLVTVDVPGRGPLADLDRQVGLEERRYGYWLVLAVAGERKWPISHNIYKIEDGKVVHNTFLD